ncbi:hypothetical protein MAR_021345 [Mya arenaria]|uniref:Ig-like domain-containing protein n=1 Tax=Mya arenaria TaxID=6604 RepID=A0ABY7EAN7_MYAAR|nr:hypothetical protein MAR_021345 [Mya arenaria]
MRGETIDITCTSTFARPPPRLDIFVKGNFSITVRTNLSIVDISKGIFKTIAKHSSNNSRWENEELLCRQSADDEGLFNSILSHAVHIDYIYPPSALYLTYTIPMRMREELVVSCTAIAAHHVCKSKWNFKTENMTYSVVSKDFTNNTFNEVISFNTSAFDLKSEIYCSVKCSEFVLTNSTILIFPQKPSVRIEGTTPAPPYNIVYLNCLSDGYPDSNITWEMVDPENGTKVEVLEVCDMPTCTLKIVSSSVDLMYNCIAQNKFGRASNTTRIMVSQRNDEKTEQNN